LAYTQERGTNEVISARDPGIRVKLRGKRGPAWVAHVFDWVAHIFDWVADVFRANFVLV
jgi:hypothetical protein